MKPDARVAKSQHADDCASLTNAPSEMSAAALEAGATYEFDASRCDCHVAEIKALRKALGAVRTSIVNLYGGMRPGSAVWGTTQYDKGWSNGIQAALGAFDHATADLATNPKPKAKVRR